MKGRSLIKATIIVSMLVILCKLLGFAREAIIAAYYGANADTDAFFFAQGMPATIFPSVCNSISTAFTATYVKRRVEGSIDNGNAYASAMLITTSAIGITLSIGGVLLAQWLVPIFAPGFIGSQRELAVHLTRIIMAAFFLTMLQYMFSAILNSNKLFYAAQVANIANNVLIIVITITLGRGSTMDLLTGSVIAGLALNVIILIICCKKIFRFQPNTDNLVPDSVDLIKLSIPIILGNGVVQINMIVDKALGSMLEEGALSALAYSGTLNALVTGVFITSLSTVLYPTLTEAAASGDTDGFSDQLLSSLGGLTVILTYISFFVFVKANDIVTIVFERGSFDTHATKLTGIVLAGYAFSYIFIGIREVLTRSFFAIQDTKTPMVNSAIGVGFNIVFSIVLVKLYGIIGIALGTVFSNIIIAFLLIKAADKRIHTLSLNPFYTSFAKQIVSGLIMCVSIFAFDKYVGMESIFISFLIDACFGAVLFLTILYIMKCRECIDLIHLVVNKARSK